MGAARNKETLEWAQNDVFGKAKQTSRSVSINDHKVSTTISEKMDFLVPAAKIADMATGWLAGQAARDFTATDDSMLDHFDIEQSEEFRTTKYFCKTHFDMKKIKDEEKHYVALPKIYDVNRIYVSGSHHPKSFRCNSTAGYRTTSVPRSAPVLSLPEFSQ